MVKLPNLNLYWSNKPLHFNNNDGLLESGDRLYRLRLILNMDNENFQAVMNPGRDVIDASMVPCRGRLRMRQYIKNKYGVKLYKICSVLGKEETVDSKDHSQKVVLKLRTIYADNFYSGVALVKDSLDRKTFNSGTLRPKRFKETIIAKT